VAKRNVTNTFTTTQVIGTTSSSNVSLILNENKRQAWLGTANGGGDLYLWDTTNNKSIISSTKAGVNTFYGNITGYSPNFCTFTTASGNNVSCATEVYTKIAEIAVVPGAWYIVSSSLEFNANKNGARTLYDGGNASVGTTVKVSPSQSGITKLTHCKFHSDSSITKLYLIAWQNSGSALTVSGSISLLRLK
jgi:hypothetical protein